MWLGTGQPEFPDCWFGQCESHCCPADGATGWRSRGAFSGTAVERGWFRRRTTINCTNWAFPIRTGRNLQWAAATFALYCTMWRVCRFGPIPCSSVGYGTYGPVSGCQGRGMRSRPINYSTRYEVSLPVSSATVHLHWGMPFIHVHSGRTTDRQRGWQSGKGLHIYYN